jgi:hypothetical protein
VKKLDLSGPTQDVDELLSKLANKYSNRLPEDKLLEKRCETFLKLFNTGNFGSVILDDISRPYTPFKFKDSHFKRDREAKEWFFRQRDDPDLFDDEGHFDDKELDDLQYRP